MEQCKSESDKISGKMPKEHNIIKGFVFRFVKKSIAGSTLSSVLQEARKNDSKGLHTTVTFLNDAVDDATKARYNANAYVQLAKQASRLHLNADVSVRLSQIGSNLNNGIMDMCLSDLVEAVKGTNTRVWLESENDTDTNALLEVYRKCKDQYENIGVEIPIGYNLEVSTIKRLLKPNDMVKLTSYSYTGIVEAEEMDEASRANLKKKKAKGKNAKNGKHKKGKDSEAAHNKFILEHYLANIGKLLQADVGVAIFEHDEKLISKIASFSKEYKKSLIFELPLGYNANKMGKLQKLKINLSIYTPYGKDWTSYVVNRLTVKHGQISRLARKVL